MICRHCGATANTEARFCPACGHARPTREALAPSATSEQSVHQPIEVLRQQIGVSLAKARQQQRTIKRRHTTLSMATIILSGVGTFVAGVATMLNQPFVNDWRLTCGIAAVLGLATTIVAGIQQNHANSDLLAEVNACVARLRALEIQSTTPSPEHEAVQQQYQRLVAESTRVEL